MKLGKILIYLIPLAVVIPILVSSTLTTQELISSAVILSIYSAIATLLGAVE